LANSNNNDVDNQLDSLQEEVKKLTEEKTTLLERVRKANEENLNLIAKANVSVKGLIGFEIISL